MIKQRLRKETQVINNQFNFMSEVDHGRNLFTTTCARDISTDKKQLHLIFIDLEKTYIIECLEKIFARH